MGHNFKAYKQVTNNNTPKKSFQFSHVNHRLNLNVYLEVKKISTDAPFD